MKKLSLFLKHLEDSAIVLLIGSLLLISLLQIILRNLSLGGLGFADEAMRNGVLWLAFFGAMRASRLNNSIAINLLAHYHNIRVKRIIHFVVFNFCACVCAIAAYYCWRYIGIEYEGAEEAFLNIPVWFLESVMPFGLSVIALRFISQSTNLPAQNDAPHTT